MTRRFSVLITMLAQAMLLLSPTCFVQCVGADGHRCLELAGQGCHCCEAELSDHEHDSTACEHAAGSCCDHAQPIDLTTDAVLLSSVPDHCGCLHSAVPVASGVQVKTSAQAIDVGLINSVAFSAWSVPVVVGQTERGFQVNLLRPILDPHFVALPTSVMRV